MPCHAMHPIQDLFLESFSYELQLDMHSYLHKKFYSCKNWVLHKLSKCELDESSVFLESRHFRRRNNHGFKQDSRYVNLEYIR
jgi:hypothetical protein